MFDLLNYSWYLMLLNTKGGYNGLYLVYYYWYYSRLSCR